MPDTGVDDFLAWADGQVMWQNSGGGWQVWVKDGPDWSYRPWRWWEWRIRYRQWRWARKGFGKV